VGSVVHEVSRHPPAPVRFRKLIGKSMESMVLLGRFWIGLLLIQWLFYGPAQRLCAQSAGNATVATKPGDVNLEFSRVFIFVDKSGVVGHEHAIEGKLKSGEIITQQGQPGKVVFDMRSFDADTLVARKYLGLEGETDAATRKKVNESMLGHEILDVAKYPEARLENISLKSTGKKTKRDLPEYILEGDFVLHETKRHIEVRCDVEHKDGWNHVRGGFKILQSDYGIKPFSKMLGAVGVKDQLVIMGDLWVVPTQ